MEHTPFEVTRQWIFDHRTARGAWTKKQIEALGIKWGEKTSGWIDRIDGELITGQQARDFEAGKSQFSKGAKKKKKPSLLKRIKALDKRQKAILLEFLDSIET